MGLLEKLKNTFFEEEYVEVEEEEVSKKEPKPIAKKVETKAKQDEKKFEQLIEEMDEEEISTPKEVVIEAKTDYKDYADKEILKSKVDPNFQYFEDDDFIEPEVKQKKPEEKTKIYGEDASKLYSGVLYEETQPAKPYSNTTAKSGFKPTPIISPIYGILDKNYRKEEVIDKKDKPSSYVSRKNADVDSVRRKAFGTLEDDIVSSSFSETKGDFFTEAEETSEEEDLLYDMTKTDEAPAVGKVTIADAEEYFEDLGLEYNVDYRDSRYEKATGRRSKISEKEEIPDPVVISDDVEIEDGPKLEDNLFDLIDTMYENKE